MPDKQGKDKDVEVEEVEVVEDVEKDAEAPAESNTLVASVRSAPKSRPKKPEEDK